MVSPVVVVVAAAAVVALLAFFDAVVSVAATEFVATADSPFVCLRIAAWLHSSPPFVALVALVVVVLMD